MSVLFGDDAVAFIKVFSSRVKAQTLQVAGKLDGRTYTNYSPWLCARPRLQEPVDQELVNRPLPKGGLVTDREHLRLIQRFVSGQGRALMEQMPVTPDTWPIMIDIASSRPDAVSAFHEGRALVARSPFLEAVYDDLVECVVPQDREKPSGFDSPLARGVIFRTFPRGRTGLLAGFQLAHAMGHQAAILLQAADPLLESDPEQEIYYRVRKDRRSANHAFVSAVALGYMVLLQRDLYGDMHRPFIADEHVRGYDEFLPNAVGMAAQSVTESCRPTRVGEQVLTELVELSVAA